MRNSKTAAIHRSRTAVLLIALLAALAGGSVCANAQKYAVYSVAGKVALEQNGKFSQLQARKYLTKASRLNIADESAVTILDESKLKMYSFTRKGTSTVGELLELSGSRTKSLTKQYMSYLVKQMFDSKAKKMAHPDTYMQVTGTSYRAESKDSLLMARVAAIVGAGTSPAGTVEQQIFNPANAFASDLDVTFELVDTQTGKVLPHDIAANTACYVRVKNNTQETLYVNVLNIDADGNKYLVLPMDEDATCANLLVPSNCTVGFKSEPFITSDVPCEDAFLLVATEEPVNFSILMGKIEAGRNNASKVRVGLARLNTSTK